MFSHACTNAFNSKAVKCHIRTDSIGWVRSSHCWNVLQLKKKIFPQISPSYSISNARVQTYTCFDMGTSWGKNLLLQSCHLEQSTKPRCKV